MPANCVNCGIAFSVENEEVEWLNANDKDIPSLCPRCRAFKAGIQDESVTCNVCGKVFIYPRELRLFARMFNWPRPRRCIGGCKRQAGPLSELEQQMADFLRRLRASRKLNSPIRNGYQDMTVGRTSRMGAGSGPPRVAPPSSDAGGATAPDLGGSLAQALKEFQEKKRRRG